MKEHRKYPRVAKALPIKLSDSDKEFDVLTETKNISASGAYCWVNRPLELMTKLNLVILIPVKKNKKKLIEKINCIGVVVRLEHVDDASQHPYRVAIYFSEIQEADRRVLQSCIKPFLQ